LEVRPGEGGLSEGVIVREDRETGDVPVDPTGSDELIAAMRGDVDSPLDMDWREAALDTDSFADVGSGSGSGEGFDFDRLEAGESSLAEHLLAQLHGTGGAAGRIAEAIVNELEETGYLETPLRVIAEALEVPLDEAEGALALVQSLDPPGVAARGLEECIARHAPDA